MAGISEDLQHLIQLQAQDVALDALQSSIDKIPAQIQTLREAFEQEKAQLASIKEKATRAQLAKKEKEISLSQKEEAVRKHGQELNQVKTNDAYRALLAEIDKAKAEISDLETAILTCMEDIDQATREEKAAAVTLKERDAKLQAEIQKLEAEKAKLSAEADQKRAARNSQAQGITPVAVKLYENLRSRRGGVAVAPVKGTMCGVCRITIMPQSLIELKKGTVLVTCESCQRILYHPDSVSQPSPAATGASSATPANPTA